MGRLKSLPPRITALPDRLGAAPMARDESERLRLREREKSQPWRKWYHSAEWKALRLLAFRRDRYTCQRTGELCIGKGQAPNSPVANHKIPHHGDRKLFFDLDNIQTVTKAVHDGLIQSEERSGRIG